MERASVPIVVLMALGVLAGCNADEGTGGAADPGSTTTAPSATAPETTAPDAPSTPGTSAPASSPVTVAVAAGDEVYLDTTSRQLIHRDGNGAYICVLRRSDDLADLRASFTGSDDPSAEAS